MSKNVKVGRPLSSGDLNRKEKARRASYHYDWKNGIRGWRYKGNAPTDPEWIADRDALFQENGNGWWWYQGCTTVDYTNTKYRANKELE